MTTGNENKEPDVIETLPEEENGEMENGELAMVSRLDVKRRSTRRLVRRHSTKRGKFLEIKNF